MKIDDLDRQLLTLMAQDGRMTSAEMARAVGENERKVAYRVNSLLQSGVISILGIFNPEFFGYEVIADIYCQVELGKIEEVAKKIAEFPEVQWVQAVFGDHDVAFQVLMKSSSELSKFVSTKLAGVPGIIKTTTNISSAVFKDIHEWIPPEVQEDGENTSEVEIPEAAEA
jgi:Lrp/AsnC family transcriptional regulator for asnA, asnC and gidA